MSCVRSPQYEGTHGTRATEIFVRQSHESSDPVCDGAKRVQIVVYEPARSAGILEILNQEELGGIRRHGITASHNS